MKLKSSVKSVEAVGSWMIMDAVSDTMIETNETGARIVELMLDGTADTEAALTEALCGEYDAPAALVGESVRRMLDCLRDNGFAADEAAERKK